MDGTLIALQASRAANALDEEQEEPAAYNAIKIYALSQSQTEELDLRIIPWLPSDAFLYILFSLILSIIFLGSCIRFWKKLLLTRKIHTINNILIRLLLWLLWLVSFIVVCMPFLALPLVIFIILKVVYRFIIYPILWCLFSPFILIKRLLVN